MDMLLKGTFSDRGLVYFTKVINAVEAFIGTFL